MHERMSFLASPRHDLYIPAACHASTKDISASSVIDPLSFCILGIETSFNMVCWDLFPGHGQEDRGQAKVGGTKQRNEKNPKRVETADTAN